jgi:hypothetical protein
VPYKPGESGNPRGKTKGTRHRTTLAAQALLEGEAETLSRKAIELALAGDTVALRLCLDRILPARRARISLPLPPVTTAADVTAALAVIVAAVGSGEIAPDEAQSLAGVIEAARKSLEMIELEQRLARLEAAGGR